VQIVGKVPFNVNELEGRHGVDERAQDVRAEGRRRALRRRRNPRVLLSAIIDGGGHERGMRSGTLNVTGIVGFGKAAELCRQEMAVESERLRKLRDYLNEKLHSQLDELYINGSMEHRLPHNLNISFAYVEGESLLMGINDVAVSSGSACTVGEPRAVLRAQGAGAGDDLAHSSIRFGSAAGRRKRSGLRRRQADLGRHQAARHVHRCTNSPKKASICPRWCGRQTEGH
jgi:cysteine desulfurase